MKLEIGFGTTPQIVELPDKNIDGILYPNEVTVATTGAEEVNRSLSHPIGTRSLEEIVKGKAVSYTHLPSLMALSVTDEIQSRLIGFRHPVFSRISLATSSPSRPASVAIMISPTSFL